MQYSNEQFEPNQAWMIFRIKTMMMIEDKTPDIYVLMDIGSDYIFGNTITLDESLDFTELDNLMLDACKNSNSRPELLLSVAGDPAEDIIREYASKQKISFKAEPLSSLEGIIDPVTDSFNKYISDSPGDDPFEHDEDYEAAMKYIPDTYDPCTCGSGKKFKFCCKPFFFDIVNAMADAEDGHYKKALEWMKKAEKKGGQTPEILCRYAIVYSFFDREKSEEFLEKCFSLYPGHPRANYVRGIDLKQRGDYKGALEAYQTALRNYPPGDVYHLNEVWNNIGTVYCEEKRYADAKRAWEKALEYMPKDKTAARNLICMIHENPDVPEKIKKGPSLHLINASKS